MRAVASPLLFQQTPVSQTTQNATGLQGVQPRQIAARRVVHHTGLARVDQRLGFVGRQSVARQRLEPAVIFLGQQMVQKQRDLELILLPVRRKLRQG